MLQDLDREQQVTANATVGVAERDQALARERSVREQLEARLQQIERERAAAADHAARVEFVGKQAEALKEFGHIRDPHDVAERASEYMKDQRLALSWQYRDIPAADIESEPRRV